jgi:hypothetical protein
MKLKRILTFGSAALLCICALPIHNRTPQPAESGANTAILKLADSGSQTEKAIVDREPSPITHGTLGQASASIAPPYVARLETKYQRFGEWSIQASGCGRFQNTGGRLCNEQIQNSQ